MPERHFEVADRSLSIPGSPNWLVGVAMALLVLAPVSSRSAGLLFFVFLGWTLWVGFRWPLAHFEFPLVRTWLVLAGMALLMRGLATFFWSDSWGGRHFEGRVFLMALAAWYLLPRCRLAPGQKSLLLHALSIACWVALAVVWVQGRDLSSSNALPWAVGVSFVVCLLLGGLLSPAATWRGRLFWLSGVFGGSAAVLLSQSRGSFGLVLWGVGVLLLILWSWFRSTDRRPLRSAAVVLVVGVCLSLVWASRLLPNSMDRVHIGVQEASRLFEAVRHQQVTPQVIDSSVGARLYMWVRVVEPLSEHAVTGVGQKQREEWIGSLGRESGSSVVTSLNHLHSDPLTIWYDHGLLGLGSYLALAFGLVFVAWQAWARYRDLAVALGGIAFMHISAGLTNFNTIHNFYGIMFSLCIFVAFWLALPVSRSDAHHDSLSRT